MNEPIQGELVYIKYYEVAPRKTGLLGDIQASGWAARQDAGHPDANKVLQAIASFEPVRAGAMRAVMAGPPWHPTATVKEVAKTAKLTITATRTHIERLRELSLARDEEGFWQIGIYAYSGDYVRYYPAPHPAVPRELRDLVFARDEHQCIRCHATDDLTIDHIVARIWGGQNEITNLRVLCRSCNSSKGAN